MKKNMGTRALAPQHTIGGAQYGKVRARNQAAVASYWVGMKPFPQQHTTLAARLMGAMGAALLACVGAGTAHADTPPGCMGAVQNTESALRALCPLSEGLAAFEFDGLWGYVDAKGEVKIAPKFERADSFSQGLAAARVPDGAEGYIGPDGEWVIAPQFDSAWPFGHDRAMVWQCDQDCTQRVRYLDRQGKPINAVRYHQGTEFFGQRALVETKSPDEGDSSPHQSFIDLQGRLQPIPAAPAGSPVGTRVEVTKGRDAPERWFARVLQPDMLVSPGGKTVLLGALQAVEDVAGPNAVVVSERRKGNRALGLMDEQGRWLVAPKYVHVGKFRQGIAPAGLTVPDGGERQEVLLASSGREVAGPFLQLAHMGNAWVARSAKGPMQLLNGQGQRLASLNCGDNNADGAANLVSEEMGWTVLNTCDQRHWVISPSGRHWSGAGHVDELEVANRQLLVTRQKGRLQVFDVQGKAVLSAAMQTQLGEARAVLLSNSGQGARRPLAWFDGRDDAAWLLTASGRLVRMKQTLAERARSTSNLWDSPILVRNAEGVGAMDEEGRWLVAPKAGAGLQNLRNGWLAREGSTSSEIFDTRGRALRIEPYQDIVDVAPGISWLAIKGNWHVLQSTPRGPQLRAIAGLSTRWEIQSSGATGLVVLRERPDQGLKPVALYTAQGQRLPIPDVVQLRAVTQEADDNGDRISGPVLGWVGSTRGDGAVNLVLSAQGKVLRAAQPVTLSPSRGGRIEVQSPQGRGQLAANGQLLLAPAYDGVEEKAHGWLLAKQEAREAMFDGENRWLLVAGLHEQLSDLLTQDVARDRRSRQAWAADVNGRRLRKQTVLPATASDDKELKAEWRLEPSPLPPAKQHAVDDANHANWVLDNRTGDDEIEVRDLNGQLRWQGTLKEAKQVGAAVVSEATVDDQTMERLHGAQGQVLAQFAGAKFKPNGPWLNVEAMRALPAKHPLARPALLTRYSPELQQLVVRREPGKPVQMWWEQVGIVRASDGQVLAQPQFDAVGNVSEGHAAVSHMGNLGMVDAQGQLVLQSAWRCGTTPVLLNGAGAITWPEALRGRTQAPCTAE